MVFRLPLMLSSVRALLMCMCVRALLTLMRAGGILYKQALDAPPYSKLEEFPAPPSTNGKALPAAAPLPPPSAPVDVNPSASIPTVEKVYSPVTYP